MKDEQPDPLVGVETEREVTDLSAIAVLNKSEIDQQIATAKRFPRSMTKFRNEALQMATLNEEIAGECYYVLPRADKTIEGPSVRLAEIIASAWGNCRSGARVIGEEAEFIIAQGAFFDVERNVAVSFEVKRRIVDRNKRRYSADMIAVTANAACSIALRNAIFRGIPKAFWQDIYLKVKETAAGDQKTLAARRAIALDYLKKQGVVEGAIFKKLGVKGVEDIGLEELVVLRGLATAIKDGEISSTEAFAEEANVSSVKGADGLKARLDASQKQVDANGEPDLPLSESTVKSENAQGLADWLTEMNSVKLSKLSEWWQSVSQTANQSLSKADYQSLFAAVDKRLK